MADMNKIRQQNRRAVEGWIAGYEQAKQLLSELTAEAAEWGMAPVADGMPRGGGHGDPTFARMLSLSALPEIAMTRRIIRAIEAVYGRCGDTKRQGMELYFWRGKHYLEVCSRLNMEKSNLYHHKKEITDEVAAELGVRV